MPEAIGLLVCDLSKPVRLELINRSGSSLSDEEKTLLERANDEPVKASVKTALDRLDSICSWFAKEAADLKQICKANGIEITIPLRSHDEAVQVLGPYDRNAKLMRQVFDIYFNALAVYI